MSAKPRRRSRERYTSWRLDKVMTAWETMRPNKVFYDMSLDQFKEEVRLFTDARREIEAKKNELSHALSKLQSAAPNVKTLLKGVVSAVKGDRSEQGEDGPLFAAMGYIPTSRRASGLQRPRKEEPSDAGSSTEDTV